MNGRSLSHYKILEEISRGGMEIVLQTVGLKLNRDVARKVLPPDTRLRPDAGHSRRGSLEVAF